jgi:hypothetical protein
MLLDSTQTIADFDEIIRKAEEGKKRLQESIPFKLGDIIQNPRDLKPFIVVRDNSTGSVGLLNFVGLHKAEIICPAKNLEKLRSDWPKAQILGSMINKELV